MLRSLIVLPLVLSVPAFAAEKRELGAHEHGHGELNIAIEGQALAVELHVPGADIVGFEHAATSAEDKAKIEEAKGILSKPLDLFVLPEAAGCTLANAGVELITEGGDHDDHDDHAEHKHDDHADEKHDDHAEHKHDDHADEKHDDHAEHKHDDHGDEKHAKDEHDHDEHAEEEGHTEFHGEYAINCADPGALDSIKFVYFDQFPNAKELDVQMISDKGTAGFEVERESPTLDLSGNI